MLEGHSIGVGLDGKIAFVGKAAEAAALCLKHGLLDPELITLDGTKFLMPGMVDTHVHASQYPYSGTGYDLPLLQWLTKYTFPTEVCAHAPPLKPCSQIGGSGRMRGSHMDLSQPSHARAGFRWLTVRCGCHGELLRPVQAYACVRARVRACVVHVSAQTCRGR